MDYDDDDVHPYSRDEDVLAILSDPDDDDEGFNNHERLDELIGAREQQQYAAEDLAAIQTPADSAELRPIRASIPVVQNEPIHSDEADRPNEIRAEPVVLIERIAGEEVPSPEPVQDPHFSIVNAYSSDGDEQAQPGLPSEIDETRKRKRSSSKSQSPEEQKKADERKMDEDPDDGSLCTICLDNWEMSGVHRLTSLKCGHLFGHSCIKRWLQSCPTGSKVCPTCKSRAAVRDLRFLYAKRICAIDKSEEYRLRDLLQLEKVENSKLQQNVGMLRIELAMNKQKLSQVEYRLQELQKGGVGSTSTLAKLYRYKLAKDKVFELAKDAGSRVMLSGRISPTLAISQKSNQSLFPGFGVRILDVNTFRSTNFLHMSSKPVRDLSYSTNEGLIVSATLEKCVKLFNVHDRTVVNTFVPTDKPIWACALDTEAKNFVYLGSGHGSTYIYDIRNANQIVEEFKNEDDSSPVIAIAAVFSSVVFPFGGFLVCKLKSLWFHEYMASQQVISTRLNVEGPFVSMSYDSAANSLLVATRMSKQFPARYIVSKLVKLNEIVALDTLATFDGSKVAPIMSRSTQIIMANGTLVSAYLQDRKMLGLWNITDKYRTQSLPISDIVYDTCPIYDGDTTYVAALTENKCRFYKVIADC